MAGRRPSARAGLATPLEDDDILGQILLRLPPRPSSLPRAAAVCKRWRRVVSSPHFRRSFCGHHRKPPLLGFLTQEKCGDTGFTPALDPPDRIPAERFSLPFGGGTLFLGCRHGRALSFDLFRFHFLVWDPVTGDHRRVSVPPAVHEVEICCFNGAVVCAAGEQDHVHGCFHLCPFKVAFISSGGERIVACVYSSHTNAWSDLISIPTPWEVKSISTACPNILVGNSICWFATGEASGILEFNLERQSLAIVDPPQHAFYHGDHHQLMVPPTDGADLGFLVLSGYTAKLWKRKVNANGDGVWVLRNTMELTSLLSLRRWGHPPKLLGLVEDHNAMLLSVNNGVVFMVHLDSEQFEKLPKKITSYFWSPFTSFYTAGGLNIFGEPWT
ncbi:hypothetical protein ACP70R_019788 [Stipagrostis hirtigluma subsp. patula]